MYFHGILTLPSLNLLSLLLKILSTMECALLISGEKPDSGSSNNLHSFYQYNTQVVLYQLGCDQCLWYII